jgi:tetratricopeptide (TPR) repeat protein
VLRPRRGGLDLRVVLAVGFVLLLAISAGAWWLFRGRRPGPAPEAKGTAGLPSAPAASKAKGASDDPVVKAQQLFEQGKVDAAIQTLLAIPDSDPRHNEALTKIDQYRNAAAPTPAASAPGPGNIEELRAQGFAAMRASRYIDVVKALDPVVKARPDDAEAAQALKKAREQVDALRSAAKSYSEGDYDGAIKLLWELRKADPRNQDVEEYLLNAYVNSGIQALQSGNMNRASAAFLEATRIRPTDAEAQRLQRFAKRYAKGTNDLLSRIFVRHLTIRQ